MAALRAYFDQFWDEALIAYEAPARLVLNWQIGADWRYDPTITSEVEVRFVAEAETRTRVELEHRNLAEAYGEKAEQIYGTFDSPEGWGGILDRYGRAAGS